MIVAVGPVSHVPSWNWVGMNIVSELSKYCDVEIFKNFESLPAAKVIIIVKQLPPSGFLKAAKGKSKVIYCPIDYFFDDNMIAASAHILSGFEFILTHAESLKPLFNRFAPTFLVEHDGRYTLPERCKYRPQGYVLWIGGYQFVPYLMNWFRDHPPRYEVKLLTDYKNKSAIGRAQTLSRELNISLSKLLKSCEMYEWSEKIQTKMMKECKAAIDIKGTSFSQVHKPPTKGQKYISSGIPFAINQGNCCLNYFRSRSFNVCDPTNTERWFSENYWRETMKFAKHLRDQISSTTVGRTYLRYVELCLESMYPTEKLEKPLTGLSVHRYHPENP